MGEWVRRPLGRPAGPRFVREGVSALGGEGFLRPPSNFLVCEGGEEAGRGSLPPPSLFFRYPARLPQVYKAARARPRHRATASHHRPPDFATDHYRIPCVV